ncbi:MAG: hypothetical protein C0501_05410 [Isosphaera sp.]|nr:hypothetical protein [Isosphaera sp.]
MTDEDALLAAIAAAPAEDTPRLVYADWLDEHDRPIRAEFVRLQVDIARKQDALTRAELDRHVALFERQQELLDHHRDELLGPLAALPAEVEVEFDRGFVSRVELPVDAFLVHAGSLATATPLPAVGVHSVTARLTDFVASPYLHCVRRLRAWSAAFAAFPGVLWPAAEGFAAAAARLSALEVLDLEGCGLNNLAATDLPRPVSLPGLADLDLSNNEITDAGVVYLLDSPLPRQLKRLILGGNPIGDQGAIELADRWPKGAADRLEYLNLRFTNIGPPGHQALLARFGGRIDLF